MNENDKQADLIGEVTSGMQQNGSQCFKTYGDDALPIGTKIYATAHRDQQAAQAEPVALDAIYAAWRKAGVDICGGNWEEFVKHLPPLYTEAPVVAVNESAKAVLNSVALVAHHGGLIDLSESEALILIRKLTVQHHDWKQTIGETRALLKAIAAEQMKGGV